MEPTENDEKTNMLAGYKKPIVKTAAANIRKTDTKNKHGSTCRSTFAQCLATIANSMLFLGVGMMVASPTVVIGVLHQHKSEGELSLNDDEASWFGSLMLLTQPLGCVVASFLQHYIGRKSGMILMNIPELISWILLYTATTVNTLYISAIMMGISAGFMEAPGLAYIGEISEPRIRGMLTSYANMNVCIGMLIEFFLGSIVDWRTAIGISAVVPVISVLLIACVPDSPVWLLSKGRKEEALEALQWLRGWASENKVKAEFEELSRYTEASTFSRLSNSNGRIIVDTLTSNDYVDTPDNGLSGLIRKFKEKISYMLRPPMLRPFRLVIGYQFFFHCAALTGIRCYLVEIFALLEMPIKPQWLVFLTSVVMIMGGITCILTVKYLGKRKLSLFSLIACSICCIILGGYTYYRTELHLPWIPMITFCLLYYFTTVGISPIPWMLISEVFPVSGRSFGAGFSAAAFYVIGFVFSKTYLDLENIIGLPACLLIYGSGGILGLLFLYVYLPETEGKTLAEVENCFLNKKRKPESFH